MTKLSGKTLEKLVEMAGTAAKKAREKRKEAERARDNARKGITNEAAQALADEARQYWIEAGNQAVLADAALEAAQGLANAVTAEDKKKAALTAVAAARAAAATAATPSDLSGKTLEQLLEIARTAANSARQERKKAEDARDRTRNAMTKEAAQALADEARQHWIEAGSQAAPLADCAAVVAEARAKNEKEAAPLAAAARTAATAAAQDAVHAEKAADAAKQIADTA
jgi:hypothetical protein